MINAAPSLKAAVGISGQKLAAYLHARGWESRPSKVDGVSIFSKKVMDTETPISLILPIQSGFADERRRVADALRTLAEIEHGSVTQVADDVRRVAAAPDADDPPILADVSLGSSWGGFLSDAEIEKLASKLREELGVANNPSFNIVDILEREFPKLVRDFRIEIFTADQVAGSLEAYSRPFPPRIFVRQDIHKLAIQNEPRSRFALAHEMAHVWLWSTVPPKAEFLRQAAFIMRDPIAEVSRAAVMTRMRREEWEASKFAAAFLMPIDVVIRSNNPRTLSIYFNVTVEAARFRIKVASSMRREKSKAYARLMWKIVHGLWSKASTSRDEV